MFMKNIIHHESKYLSYIFHTSKETIHITKIRLFELTYHNSLIKSRLNFYHKTLNVEFWAIFLCPKIYIKRCVWIWIFGKILQDNTSDCKVYITLLFLLILCGTIVSLKILLTLEDDDLSYSTFQPLQRQVNSRFK